VYRITYNLNDNNNELVKRILNSFQITRWLQHKVYRIERRNNRLHLICFCHHIVSISASYFFNGFLVLSEKSCSWILGNIKCISNSTAIEFVADLHRFVLLFLMSIYLYRILTWITQQFCNNIDFSSLELSR
jgi:hypothetical protein